MREILFRGKSTSTGDWIYGYLNQHRGDEIFDNSYEELNSGDYYIRDWAEKIDSGHYGMNYKVIPETIGQFTELKDKNDDGIFEGDIVRRWSDYFFNIEYGLVIFEEGAFMVKWNNCGKLELLNSILNDIIIVCNIHDVSNLIEMI